MALRAHVAKPQTQILRQFTLNTEVVLHRVLRPHVRLEFAKQQDGTEDGPIHRLAARRIQYAVERIRIWKSCLRIEGGIKEGLDQEGATAERWLRAELLKHQLLDWVIEHSPAGVNAGFTGSTGTIGDPYAWGERLVIRLGHAGGDAAISRYDQTRWKFSRTVGCATQKRGAVWRYLTGVNAGTLAGPECLHMMTDICKRRVQFPAQAVVQCDIGTNLPTVLREQIHRGGSDILVLCRSLLVGVRQAQQVVRV